MVEPCVMDIKIGKRTWDPLADEKKIECEETKYTACKQTLGICIPGFQVYSVKTGIVKRYGKEYGKKLNETSIKEGKFIRTLNSKGTFNLLYSIAALKLFLNAEHGLCRALLVQLLSILWSIQRWARSQRSMKLYSSSILLAYDARYLRNNLELMNKSKVGSPQCVNPKSPISPDHSPLNSPFNWSLKSHGDHSPTGANAQEMYKKVQRSHSSQNNYDEVNVGN